uniref:serine--tRNA ligase n=1 Tax=Biomphalaria glabrata TaxID=6526 RepID=A0A182ZAK8_BIOGL
MNETQDQIDKQQFLTEAIEIDKTHTALKTKGITFDTELFALRNIYLKAQKKYDSTKRGIIELRNAKERYINLLDTRPNEPTSDVPIGTSENNNAIVKEVGTPRDFQIPIKDHKEIGLGLNMMDFETSAEMSGHGFVTLSGDLAKLERVLISLMMDHARENGYTEVSPPLLVRDKAMYVSGQLPKFEDDSYHTAAHRLIPTAEVPLVNMVAGKIFKETDLPIRYVAYTPCFRREAGGHGKSTTGLMRVHQFYKVELVSITTQESSAFELERMTSIAESILEKLKLPYRRVLLCTGETGFSSAKTYDIEVWMPSYNTYKEISSCSNCTDFQAKRMKTKYTCRQDAKVKKFVHTLNGSALAVGRLIIAILENYQMHNGAVSLPEELWKYFPKKYLNVPRET